jgi:hypothetical protein
MKGGICMFNWMKKALQSNGKARPIGQVLMENELIVPLDLEFALEHQRHTNEPLGQILLRMGALEESDLQKALLAQGQESDSEVDSQSFCLQR